MDFGSQKWPHHNCSRALTVFLTLERPSRKPESVILRADTGQRYAACTAGSPPPPLGRWPGALRQAQSSSRPRPPAGPAQTPPTLLSPAHPLGPAHRSAPPLSQALSCPAQALHLLRLYVLLGLLGQLQVRVVPGGLELVAREHKEGQCGAFHQELWDTAVRGQALPPLLADPDRSTRLTWYSHCHWKGTATRSRMAMMRVKYT